LSIPEPGEGDPMNPDTQLSLLMDRAVATLDPPTELLVRGGVERGRRLRRRRRLLQAGTGTALVGLIAAVVVSLLPGTTQAGLRPAPSHNRQSAALAPSPSETSSSTAPAPVSISPQLLAQTAIGLLPRHGSVSDLHGRASAGLVLAEFVYDDGHGAAQFDVSIGFSQDGVTGVEDKCRPHDPNSTETCTIRPDGSHLATFRGTEYSYAHDPNAIEYSAHFVRADGVEIDASEWNAPQEKDAAVSRAAPPLSMAELVDLVATASWTPWVTPAENAAAASLFVPDYVYGSGARQHLLRLERERAAEARNQARAAAEQARDKQRQYEANHGGH
jgi:hypothetical protein